MRGKFIVIDGMDGAGKGTQIRLLQEKLPGALYTREPGGTPLAEEIREMLLRTEGPASNPTSDFFLFWAARGSHVEDVVAPACAEGRVVISDRYDSSTYAFQICGEEKRELLPLFEPVRNALSAAYKPDVYIMLDLPAEVAYERRAGELAQAKSKFDLKPLEYHARVREGFKDFGRFAPVRFVDASRAPEAVHEDVWREVQAALQ